MKLNYTFKHLDHSDALVVHTEDRMSEIGRFLLKDGYGNVYFSKQKNEFCVEISVNTREKYFKATAFGADAYAAVDSAAEKLEKQFLKINKQYKDHKNPETPARWRKAA
ncbi:MAG: ribosome-associated translation inhibitor RaiA [Bdellovibrio sp.]